jgi:ATP-dependent Clp protease protease subunit
MRNKHTMPQARQDLPTDRIEWDVAPQAWERWTANITAAKEPENSISIYEPIGLDPFTGEGVTLKRIAGALRSIGDKDIAVNLNSPGGSLSEGLGIYNALREHPGRVTVNILGIAASAASLIAMAGDEVRIAKSGFLMVHNAFVAAVGNRHDMRDIADYLEPFDLAMAEIYSARTGLDLKSVQKKMDAETYINGSAAVSDGWADALLPSDEVQTNSARAEKPAALKYDTIMAKAGVPRSERRLILQELKASTPRATGGDGTPRATEEDGTPCAALMDVIKTFSIPEMRA